MTERVLVIKLGALGDVIMATALIARIVEHHRDVPVTLLTSPAFAALFAAWEGLDVVVFERRGIKAASETIRYMATGGFGRVYDLQSNDRTSVYVALSGIPERVGNHPRFPYNLHPGSPWRGDTHIFERMNTVLASAGLEPAAPRPVLPVTPADRQAVADWLVERSLTDGQFALLHAGASRRRPEKRWPHYDALADRLGELGLDVVWLGGPDEARLNAALAARLGHDATGAFSIAQLADLAGHARLAVTNDSGPMHAVAAAGIPVFALFGPSNPVRNHALGQADYVIRQDPLADLSPATVAARIEQALG